MGTAINHPFFPLFEGVNCLMLEEVIMRSRRIAIKLSLVLAIAGLTTGLVHATIVGQDQFEASGIAVHSGTGNAATGVDTYIQFTLDSAGTLTIKVDNVFGSVGNPASIATSVNAVDFHLANAPSNAGTILSGGSFVSCSPVGTCGGTSSGAPTGWALTLPTTSNFNLTDTNVATVDKITSSGPYTGAITTTEAPWFATNRIGTAFPDFSGAGTATTFILSNVAFANMSALQVDSVTVFFGDVNNGSNFLSDTALEPEPIPSILIGTGLLAIGLIKRKFIK
jgi:hypothetical protein